MKFDAICLTEAALAAAISENITTGHRNCDEYVVSFGKRAEELDAENNPELADAFRFLGAISSMHLKPDHLHHPLVPVFVGNSPGIDDPTEEQLSAIIKVTNSVIDPELRARLADLIWLRKRDYQFAEMAVKAYMESGKRTLESQFPSHAFARFERALQISALLGRQQLFVDTARVVKDIALDSGKAGYIVVACLDLLLKFCIGEPQVLAQNAEARATCKESTDDPIWQRRFWELAAKFYDRAKLKEDARRARIEVAKTFEAEAEEALKRTSAPSNLVAMGFLENAIQAYRRVSGTEADRERVHRQLLECQKKASTELLRTTSELTDVSDIIRHSRELVRGKPLSEALRTLALAVPVPKKANLRTDAEDQIKQYPLASLFAGSKLSASGKVVSKYLAGSSEDGIRHQMFLNASIHRQLVVVGQLQPMREQILSEHYVRYDDLLPFVSYNRLVPPGRELFFIQGLHDGLHGNLVAALHILVPQLENSIRCLLTEIGVVTSSVDDDGIQMEHDINMMLYEPRLAEVFTEDIIFALQGLLVEKAATNFRNQIAHGMLEYGSFFGEAAHYIWWLVLHLCALGMPREIAALNTDNCMNAEKEET